MKTTLLLLALLAPALFGQAKICDLVQADEAKALIGATGTPIAVMNTGCGYSNRDRGLRLTVTVLDMGTSAQQVWQGMKDQAAKKNWVVGDEAGMGSVAYAQLIKRSAESSAGKCGFVAVKGGKVISMFITDSAEKEDFAGKKENLDKFRPLAHKIIDRM